MIPCQFFDKLSGRFYAVGGALLLAVLLSSLVVYRSVYVVMGACALFSLCWGVAFQKELRAGWSCWHGYSLLFLVVFLAIVVLKGDAQQFYMYSSMFLFGMATSTIENKSLYSVVKYTIPLCALGVFILGYVFGFDSQFWMGDRLKLLVHHPGALAVVGTIPIIAFFSDINNISSWRGFVVSVVIPLVLVVATYARSSLLGIFCVVLWCVLRRKNIKLLLSLGVALVLIVVFVSFNEAQRVRFIDTVTDLENQSTFVSRLPIWKATLDGIQEKPFLGHSHAAFKEYHKGYIQRHKDQMDALSPIVEKKQYHAHNIILGILFSWGSVGLLALLGLFLTTWKLSFQSNRLFHELVFVFLFSQGMFSFVIHRKEGAFLLFFPLGLAFACSLMRGRDKAEGST